MSFQTQPRESASASRQVAMAATLALVLFVPLPALSAPEETEEAEKSESSSPPVSGFLGDYSNLKPHPDRKNMLVFRKEEGVLAPYARFLVEPVTVLLHEESEATTAADPEELRTLADYLRTAVVERLQKGGKYKVVEEPGPGVLRLRAAITDVVPVSGGKNTGAKAAGAVVGLGLLVPRMNLGKASIEVEMLDSQTNERLVAVVDSRQGKRFGGLIKGAKRWGDVKAAFDKWAKMFRKKLDRVTVAAR